MFVDGLRGIAALAVVLYHFRDALNRTADAWIWPWLEQVLAYGYLGVDIFFVISGFVIPFSVRNAVHTPGFLFRFGVRRSIRLDPPYWMTIFLELCAIKVGLMLFPHLSTPFPSVEKILAHLVYAQEILGYGSIVTIFWTLCYEVQFYLVFVGALVLFRASRRRFGRSVSHPIAVTVAAGSLLWSVMIFFSPMETPLHGLFIDRWYQFFLGFLAMQCYLRKRILPGFCLASLLILAASLSSYDSGADNGLSVLAVAWILVIASQRGKMSSWLSWSASQFLGRISYSLYLIHPVLGWRLIMTLRELNDWSFTAVQAWMAMVVGVGISVAAAWTMCRLIEVPSIRACREIRLDQPLTFAELTKGLRAFCSRPTVPDRLP